MEGKEKEKNVKTRKGCQRPALEIFEKAHAKICIW